MKLNNVVPFGRSMGEYQQMFALSEGDLDGRILGVGDGPASFNAEMFALGKVVISVDPLYRHGGSEIEGQFHAVLDDVIAQVEDTPSDWIWTYHKSPQHLRENRVRAMETFLADYDQGRAAGRYVIGELPVLPFETGAFDLALCSHFLFLYSKHLDEAFHLASVLEMLRVASEVRVFPLISLSGERSPHLESVPAHLGCAGYTASVEKVTYELQRGGNEMLRIRRISANQG